MTTAVQLPSLHPSQSVGHFWEWIRPSHRDFFVAGVSARYSCCGSGPPLLLLASPGTSVRAYSNAVRALCPKFTVVCLELPRPRAGETWTTDDYASWVLELVRYMPLAKPVVLAHARSVPIAAALASLAPDEIGHVALVDAFDEHAGTWIQRLSERLQAAFSALARVPVFAR